jgi:hypothetical protein
MVEKECYFVESMGGINEHIPSTTLFHMSFSSFLNVENVRTPNMSNVDVSQLDVVKTQVVAWRPHSCMFICWGFFCCPQWPSYGSYEIASVAMNKL